MYLSGSKWNVKKRRRKSNPLRILFLLLLIAGIVYIERVVVPTVPPLFVETPIPTRSPAAIALEADSLFEAGKLSLAETAYLEAIAIDPQEPAYYIELARLQVFAGNYEAALTNASNAVMLDQNSAKANAVLGWAMDFVEGENLADAKVSIERALELDPNNALYHAYYAEVLIDDDISTFDQALSEAQTAVRLDPNLMESHRALGYVWELTGNYEQAFDAYDVALRIQPNLSMLYVNLGNIYLNQAGSDPGKARENYSRASALAPTDVLPLRLIAQAYAREGEFGKASQYAQNAAELDPGNPRLHGDFGRMLYKNQDYNGAIEELRLAIHGGSTPEGGRVEGLQLDPSDFRVVEFYYTYGLALAKQNQCDLAGQIAEALITGVPDDEIAVFNAQEILILCGRIDPTPTAEPAP